MCNYAILENNQVTNIIVADDEATALAVSRPGARAIKVDPSEHITSQGSHTYNERYKVFVPEGKTYNPITESFEDIKADK
jgi:hypothetical protein